jgi:flagellar basal body-associated protein FliL
MQVVLGIISFVLLGVIIYFVVSPKSSRLLRISAIIALALIGLSVGVCGVFLVRGPAKVETEIPLPFLTDAEQKPQTKTNIGVIIGYFLAFVILFGLVFYSSRKEKEKKREPAKKPVRNQVFEPVDEDALDIGHELNDDESFDIGIY